MWAASNQHPASSLAPASNVAQTQCALLFRGAPNVSVKRASLEVILMTLAKTLMNAKITSVEKMHNVSTLSEDTTADVSLAMLEIPLKIVPSLVKAEKTFA